MRIVISFCVALFFSIATAGMQGNTVEIRGKITSFNGEHVHLKYRGKKTVAPRKYVTKKQLKSKNEIRVFVPTKEYFGMLKKIKGKKR